MALADAAFLALATLVGQVSVGSATSAPSRVSLAPAVGRVPFSVTADRLEAKGRDGTYVAEGNVALSRAGVVMYADRITLDEVHAIAIAEGTVTIVEGRSVASCRRVEMHLPELAGGLENAELRIKSELPENIREALSASELRRYGTDELILTGEEVERMSPRKFEVAGGSFTACDCGDGNPPSWRIEAGHADVDLDSGAWLALPVFYARGIPVFALPLFYVPLGSRRTGLLTPRVSGLGNPVTGLQLTAPLYIAPADSWDATLEAGFLFARGPSSALELRYAPSAEIEGQARAAVILDYGQLNPGERVFARDRSTPLARYALSARHTSRWDAARVAADLNLLGDPAYVAEFSDAFLTRQAEYTSSRLTFTTAYESGVRLGTGLALLQDLRPQRYRVLDATSGAWVLPDLRDVALFSGDRPGPGDVRYRFAELRLDAPPHPLLAKDSIILGEARLALHGFLAPAPELTRFARADLRPGLSIPLHLGDVAVLEPSFALRLTGWAGRSAGDDVSATRFGVIGKAALFTEIGRRYGDWFHRIRPEAQYLIIPHVGRTGDAAFETEDEIDLLESVSQVSFRIQTDLFHAASGRRVAGFEAWIGRDLGLPRSDVEGAGTSEIVLRGDIEILPLESPVRVLLDGRAAVDPKDVIATELLAGITLATGRGDMFSVLYGDFSSRMPTNTFIAPEELVPSRTIDAAGYVPLAESNALLATGRLDVTPWSPYRGLTVSTAPRPIVFGDVPVLRGGRLTMGFELSLSFDREALLEAAAARRSIVRNTRTLVRWDSGCNCWGAGVVVTTDRTRPPGELGLPGFNLQVIFELARLGEVTSP